MFIIPQRVEKLIILSHETSKDLVFLLVGILLKYYFYLLPKYPTSILFHSDAIWILMFPSCTGKIFANIRHKCVYSFKENKSL